MMVKYTNERKMVWYATANAPSDSIFQSKQSTLFFLLLSNRHCRACIYYTKSTNHLNHAFGFRIKNKQTTTKINFLSTSTYLFIYCCFFRVCLCIFCIDMSMYESTYIYCYFFLLLSVFLRFRFLCLLFSVLFLFRSNRQQKNELFVFLRIECIQKPLLKAKRSAYNLTFSQCRYNTKYTHWICQHKICFSSFFHCCLDTFYSEYMEQCSNPISNTKIHLFSALSPISREKKLYVIRLQCV